MKKQVKLEFSIDKGIEIDTNETVYRINTNLPSTNPYLASAVVMSQIVFHKMIATGSMMRAICDSLWNLSAPLISITSDQFYDAFKDFVENYDDPDDSYDRAMMGI